MKYAIEHWKTGAYFPNIGLLLRGAIVNAVNKHARTQIFRMNKHACYKIVIEEVIAFALNKHMLNGRRAITRRENRAQFRMASEVLRHRSHSSTST